MENFQDQLNDSTPRQIPVRQTKKGRFGKVFLLVFSYVIVGLVVWQVSSKIQNDPNKVLARAEAEARSVLEKVSSLMILPSDDVPQIIPIDDAENLAKNQLFFSKVENGDQLLIFTGAQQAIIYRPSLNKIVNSGPVITGKDASTSQDTIKASQSSAIVNKSTSTPKDTDSGVPKKANDQ